MTRLRRGALLAVLTFAFSSATAQPAPEPEDGLLALRLAEYEALLDTRLDLSRALCIDDLLGRRWPRADVPSPRQWQRMQEQARQASDACAAAPGDTPRAAGTIRRAMELQVERQRALAERQARLRACLAQPPERAACDALEQDAALTPAQRARLERAREQGRR